MHAYIDGYTHLHTYMYAHIHYACLRNSACALQGGTSLIADFFDVDDLASVLPVITTEEFMAQHRKDTSPDGIVVPDTVTLESMKIDKRCHSPFTRFIRTAPGVALAGPGMNPITNVVFWKNISSVKKANMYPPPSFFSGRSSTELVEAQINSRVLHFAMESEGNERYLGQVASMWAFENADWEKQMFRAMRDGLHYKEEIFDVAARVASRLGFEGYASMHVRRNELQYKEVFVSANRSLEGAGELIKPRDTIYLATDEAKQGFFDVFEEKGHTVYRYQDFFGPKGGYILKNVPAAHDSKIIGMIEQVICACGRVFIGTKLSTFSAHILRLRGHIGVKNKHVYYHSSGPYTADSRGERGKRDGNYFTEFEEIYNVDRR